jgi:hypothetical protein
VRYQWPLSVHLLKKYEYQYRQHRQYESKDKEYEHRTGKSLKGREDSHDHWHCTFFKYCWNSSMSRLPTVNNCPECGPRKHGPRKVSVFQHVGPMLPQDKRAKPSREENFKGKRKKIKRENTYAIADEQPSTLGLPDFKKGLGLQESIEVITKHSTEGIHRWPLWLQDGHGWLL